MSEHNLSPRSKSWSSLLFGFGFLVGLVNGSPVLSVQHVNLTQVLDGKSIPLRSSRARVSLSLDTVVVGEVDELEEDVG